MKVTINDVAVEKSKKGYVAKQRIPLSPEVVMRNTTTSSKGKRR